MKKKKYITPHINAERISLYSSFLESSIGPGNQVEYGSGAAKDSSYCFDEEDE